MGFSNREMPCATRPRLRKRVAPGQDIVNWTSGQAVHTPGIRISRCQPSMVALMELPAQAVASRSEAGNVRFVFGTKRSRTVAAVVVPTRGGMVNAT